MTAQFVSVDPLVSVTGQAYAYAEDSPVNGVDPLGLWGWNPIADVGDVGHHWRGIVQVVAVTATTVALGASIVATGGADAPEAIAGEDAAVGAEVTIGESGASTTAQVAQGAGNVARIANGTQAFGECVGAVTRNDTWGECGADTASVAYGRWLTSALAQSGLSMEQQIIAGFVLSLFGYASDLVPGIPGSPHVAC